MIKKISSIVPLAILSLLLGSCGGGNPFVDDTPSGAPTLSAEGQAIDGYLNNAKVCLDVDEDGICGATEPQSRTDAEGKYKFEAEKAKLEAYRVVVAVVPGETVDMDEPDAVITESYTLTAPPGKYGVVSPITTHVVAKIIENGGTFGSEDDYATAVANVKTDLGFPEDMDITGDYVAKKKTDDRYKQVHNVAAAVADVLKLVDQDKGEDGGNFLKRLRSAGDNIKVFVKDNVEDIKKATDPKDARKRMKAAAPMKVELKLSSRDGGSVYVGHKVKVHAKIRSFDRIDLTKITRKWTVSGGSYSENSRGEMEATFSKEGTYEISVTVTNTANGSTATNSKKLRVIKSVPVKPRIAQNLKCPSTETPGQGVCGRDGFVRRPNSQLGKYIVNDTISFTANSVDPAGGKITYAWDFGDRTTDSGETVTKSYTTAGDYAVKVTASNAEGNSSEASIRVKVEEMSATGSTEKPGNPAITGPSRANAGAEIEFSATTREANCDGKVENLMFMWNMGDRSKSMRSRANEKVKHMYRSGGDYTVEVSAYCPATKLSSEKATHKIKVTEDVSTKKPGVPKITAPATGHTGDSLRFSVAVANERDVCSSGLSYEWDFGDRNTLSSRAGQTGATHAYRTAGDYTVTVKALCSDTRQESDPGSHRIKITDQGGGGGGGGGGGSPTCNVPSPSRDFTIEQYPTVSFYGNPVTFGTKAGGAAYEWDFGDGSTKSTSRNPKHTYAKGGDYCVKLKVTDGTGKKHESAMTQSVIKSCENKFETVCTGPKCLAGGTALTGGTYTSSIKAGTNGVGLWCYRNTTSSEATVNFKVDGTTRGAHVMTMVWTNGVTTTGATAPAEGRSSTGGGGGGGRRAPADENNLNDIAWQDYWDEEYYKDRWNWHHHEANAYVERQLLENPPSVDPAKERALLNQRQVVQSPSIGASKQWKDPTTEAWDGSKYPCMTNMKAGSGCPTYTTKLKHKCELTDGREVFFWVDDASLVANGGLMSDAHITEWGKMFCSTGSGAKKGIDQLKSFNTDFWTKTPRSGSYIAGDGDNSLSAYKNKLQPINIVVVKPGRGTTWAGYYWTANLLKKTVTGYDNSNEALMTFISSDGGGREGPSKYLVSTVIHELQHMLSGTTKHTGAYSAATWLEEGQAVTSEDIVTPAIHATGYNKVSNVPGVTGSRAGNYMAYGGQLSWSGWESLRTASGYDYSGAWGAFVNRTLGLGVFKYVASGKCKTDGHLDSGVAQRKCYKQGVKEEGAKGFTDTLGRMGISLWGNIPPDIAPPYLGFPARNHPKDEMGIPFAFTLPKVDFTPMARELASGHNAAKLKGLAQWFKRIDVAGSDITQTGIKIPKDHILFVLMRNEPAK